jgi:hypothetical protein
MLPDGKDGFKGQVLEVIDGFKACPLWISGYGDEGGIPATIKPRRAHGEQLGWQPQLEFMCSPVCQNYTQTGSRRYALDANVLAATLRLHEPDQ